MKIITNAVETVLLSAVLILGLTTASGTMLAQTSPVGNLEQSPIEQPQSEHSSIVHVRHKRASQTASLLVNVYDGQRILMPDSTRVHYHLVDGYKKTIFSGYVDASSVLFENIPVRENGADDFRVIVSRDAYEDGGVSAVHVAADTTVVVNLMETPHAAVFDFSHAHWQDLAANYPEYWRIISAGAPSQEEAAARWEELVRMHPNRAACILNLFTAMSQLTLPSGQTMLPYYKELIWDKTLAQDRFFAWVDPELEKQVELGVKANIFVVEPSPGILHPGATDAYKQIGLDEANLNPTFHDNDVRLIDGSPSIMFELDIDYYKDALAHTFGEVIPNMITGHLTDPMKIYQLRFNSGWAAGLAEYQPPETIVDAGSGPSGRHSDGHSWKNLRLLKFWHYMKHKQQDRKEATK